MWSMVEGRRPWPTLEGSAAMMLAQVRERPPMPPKTFPAELTAAIAAAWEHDVEQRKSAAALLAMLHDVYDAKLASAGCFGSLLRSSSAAAANSPLTAISFGMARSRREGSKGLKASKTL
jgi:hypothetical protein